MDYQKMTVAQLRKIAADLGYVTEGMRKRDIVATLDSHDRRARKAGGEGPVEVEAEIVENALAVPGKALEIDAESLASKAGEITEAIDALARVKSEMDATEEVIAEMSLEDVGLCRKALTDAIKAADEKRLEFGRILRKPVELVNSKCKELTREAEELEGRYRARERRAEEDRRTDKKNELREHYEAYAGLLLDVVPYDRMHEEPWLNKGCSIEEAEKELRAKVDRLARDWESLRAMGLEFGSEAEARLFDSLDLGEAIAWAGKLAEDKRRIEAMKAELAPEPEAMPGPAPQDAREPEIAGCETPPIACGADGCAPPTPVYGEPEPAQAAQPIPAQPMPAPLQAEEIEKDYVLADITAILRGYRLPLLQNLLEALEVAQNATGEVSQRVMVIDAASQEQLSVIGKFCGLVGVTGTFKSGTLADVVQRESRKAAQVAQQGVYCYGA